MEPQSEGALWTLRCPHGVYQEDAVVLTFDTGKDSIGTGRGEVSAERVLRRPEQAPST